MQVLMFPHTYLVYAHKVFVCVENYSKILTSPMQLLTLFYTTMSTILSLIHQWDLSVVL